MSILQIKKLQNGAFKHVDSIDGEFFLGRFSFKQEFNKAFLVEAYGAKRREYQINEIEVYDYLGSVETFTNWTNLINRLTYLGYTGIETNGIIPVSEAEKLITNNSVSGTYNIDWNLASVWDLTLTGNTTLTESNLPASGKTKTITLEVSGNYTLSYPSDWTDFITGSYEGTALLNTITIQYYNGKYKVVIIQED